MTEKQLQKRKNLQEISKTALAINKATGEEFEKVNETTAVFKSQIFGDPIVIRNIPPTTVKFDTYDIAPFTLMPSSEGLQWMCCKIAKRYAEVRNLSKVANEFGIFREEAKRLLIKHIQHTLGEEVTEKRGEDIIIEKKKVKDWV